MAARRLARWQGLHGNRGPLLRRGVSPAKRFRAAISADSLLERRLQLQTRQSGQNGRRAAGRHGAIRAATAAEGASIRRSQRLRRPEKDEPAVARPGEFWLARVHCRPALPLIEVDPWLGSELGL